MEGGRRARRGRWAAVIPLLFGVAACGPSPPDLEALRAELRALHEASVEAHLEGDAHFFARDLAEDYLVVSGTGFVRPDSARVLAQFESYLGSTDFRRYETVDGPVVGVSDDGSVGWIIAGVEVEGRRLSESGDTAPLAFASAWISLYRRVDGRWVAVANVSDVERR